MPCPIVTATLLSPSGETGVQTHFRAFHGWLGRHGHPWCLVTPRSAPSWMVYPTFAVRRLLRPVHRPASVWWYRHWHGHFLGHALRRVLRDEGPCVVYAQCPVAADAALRSRASPSQPVVLAVHFNLSQADEWAGQGMLAPAHPLYRSIRAFEARLIPRLDGLVFVSEFMRRQLEARIPAVASVPSAVVPNFLPDPGVPDLPEPPRDLVSIGTLEPRKNQRYLLEIVAAARSRGRRLTLTLVGDGPDRQALAAQADALGIAELVHFAGYVPNGAEHIAGHRAYVHAARMENLPLTLIEAMSRARPIFAVPAGGVPEVFDDGPHGRYLPADDADEAALVLLEFLGRPERMAAAGQAARQRFLDRFEAEGVAARLAGFLSTAGPRRRGSVRDTAERRIP